MIWPFPVNPALRWVLEPGVEEKLQIRGVMVPKQAKSGPEREKLKNQERGDRMRGNNSSLSECTKWFKLMAVRLSAFSSLEH